MFITDKINYPNKFDEKMNIYIFIFKNLYRREEFEINFTLM